jgi:alkanesulfonate monooxygenase SsuD/methylene tetrahydromethanopterin reductase-like flavin-dependent oxidoreductase (luciferase family)
MRLRDQSRQEATMEIGIGLPSTIPGIDGDSLLDAARRSDEAGFSTLGTIDRLVYPNYDSLIALAAAAAATERIGLTTAILIAPLRNTVALAKQGATIDNLSNGRLTLGLAVGGREDDFEAAGVDFGRRGRRFEGQLEEMTAIWAGERKGFAGPVGPAPARHRPGLVIGGTVDAAFERAARFGDGWIAGGGGPDAFAEGARKIDEAWRRAGRDGSPRKMALHYFALGPSAEDDARAYLGDYYAVLGEEIANAIVGSAATSQSEVKQIVSAFEAKGCDELILFPCSKDPAEVDRLAEVVS